MKFSNKRTATLAEIAAEKSFVLFKNENQTLPISKSIDEIAVIGALADNKAEMNSNWSGDGQPNDPITVVEALKQKYPRIRTPVSNRAAIRNARPTRDSRRRSMRRRLPISRSSLSANRGHER